MKMILLLLLTLVCVFPLRAEDWQTVDGQSFRSVQVLSHDDGFVTIICADGGARIMLSELPADLRKRFSFDPTRAAACVAKTEESDEHDQKALSDEQQKARLQQQAQAQVDAAAAASAPAPPVGVTANAAARINEDQMQISDLQGELERDQASALEGIRIHGPNYDGPAAQAARDAQAKISTLQCDVKRLQGTP
jgi:hypothetical protein